MTQEQDPNVSQSSVKITTNAKGEAQVEVKVYDSADGEIPAQDHLISLAQRAADTKFMVENRIHDNGGRVAGDN